MTTAAEKEERFLRESGLAFMDLLCDREKISIDVGASKGLYTEKMLPHSKEVYAYEPLPGFAALLKQKFVGQPVVVRACGVSDKAGTATLHTPAYTDPKRGAETLHTWSSIFKDFSAEQTHYPGKFPDVETREIKVTTIDAEGHHPAGLLKVDVEGAELEVLHGSRDTLKTDQPVVLVELEERHRKGCIAEAAQYLKQFGYEGFFVRDRTLCPLNEFDAETMQAHENLPHIRNTVKMHINNFVFIPNTKKNIIEKIRGYLLNNS